MKTRTGLEKIRSLIKKWEQVSRAFKQKRTFAALSFESAFDSILKAGTA